MGSPVASVEVRFYDQELRPTRKPREAFHESDGSLTTRFVIARRFEIERGLLVVHISHLILHLFNPNTTLNHIDYIANANAEKAGQEVMKLSQMTEQQRHKIVGLLLLTVVGGGLAGLEDGQIQVMWASGSFADELGFFMPEKEVADALQQRLRLSLVSIILQNKGTTPGSNIF